jgi:hypothetical protein
LDFLHKNNVPFIIRIKANQLVTTQDGKTQNLSTLLRVAAKLNFDARFGGNNLGEATWFSFAAKCIKGGELLIVASNRPAHRALTTYKKKWAIESIRLNQAQSICHYCAHVHTVSWSVRRWMRCDSHFDHDRFHHQQPDSIFNLCSDLSARLSTRCIVVNLGFSS